MVVLKGGGGGGGGGTNLFADCDILRQIFHVFSFAMNFMANIFKSKTNCDRKIKLKKKKHGVHFEFFPKS